MIERFWFSEKVVFDEVYLCFRSLLLTNGSSQFVWTGRVSPCLSRYCIYVFY